MEKRLELQLTKRYLLGGIMVGCNDLWLTNRGY
jgi:hypothetical protein